MNLESREKFLNRKIDNMSKTCDMISLCIPDNISLMKKLRKCGGHSSIIGCIVCCNTIKSSVNIVIEQYLEDVICQIDSRMTDTNFLKIKKIFMQFEMIINIMRNDC